jgi:cytochrome c biogenesis protein
MWDSPARPRHKDWTLGVNDPLRLDGANVYLLGHGYAPVLRYTDRYGKVFTTTAPFPAHGRDAHQRGGGQFPYATSHREPEPRTPPSVGLAGVYRRP